jgi:predicted Ser/Thr protein kinase
VNLRLREEFRQQLVRAGEKSGRSFNQEMVHRLEESFSREDLGDIKKHTQTLDAVSFRLHATEEAFKKYMDVFQTLEEKGYTDLFQALKKKKANK